MTARVSFIVTCYNYQRFVAQAIASILGQTLQAIEVIVIEDASQDGSREVLEDFRSDARVHLVLHERNQGHIRSYNEGLALAGGEFVGVLAADDFVTCSDAIARQVAVFDAHPEVGYVYSAFSLVDEESLPFRVFQPWPADCVRGGLDEFSRLILWNYVCHSGTLVRRSCHDVVGVYDPRLPHAGDWDLWLRLSARYSVGYIADPLYAYRQHGSNMSVARHAPRQENRELLETVAKAFAALPPDAPPEIVHMRRSARYRAVLNTAWGDRSLGRVGRSWAGMLDAAARCPALLMTPLYYGSLLRLLTITVLGHDRYEQLAAWKQARFPARHPASG
jgi:GT2 family glycosyltransferase